MLILSGSILFFRGEYDAAIERAGNALAVQSDNEWYKNCLEQWTLFKHNIDAASGNAPRLEQ
jgi:hypothetical protein